MADGVEGAAPKSRQFPAEQVAHAAHHLAGCLVGEGQQEDAVGGNALFQQKADAIGEGARLAGTRARDYQRRPRRRGDGRELLRVQFRRIINMQVSGRIEGLEHVVARHPEKLGECGKLKREKDGGHPGSDSG